MIGNYVNYLGPQHSFPIPNGILNTDGRNTIAIAVWNLDGSTGGLGKVSLTNYGSYASSLRVAAERQPALRPPRSTRCRPLPDVHVTLDVPATVQPGTAFTATATVTRRAAGRPTSSPALTAPAGWTVDVARARRPSARCRRASATVRWTGARRRPATQPPPRR